MSSWLDDSQVCVFNQLRVVKASRISGVKAEVELIRFLLLNSPVLEKMILRPLHSSGDCRLLKKLLMFRRASAQAQIEYLHPLKLVHSYSESDSSSPSDSD